MKHSQFPQLYEWQATLSHLLRNEYILLCPSQTMGHTKTNYQQGVLLSSGADCAHFNYHCSSSKDNSLSFLYFFLWTDRSSFWVYFISNCIAFCVKIIYKNSTQLTTMSEKQTLLETFYKPRVPQNSPLLFVLFPDCLLRAKTLDTKTRKRISSAMFL